MCGARTSAQLVKLLSDSLAGYWVWPVNGFSWFFLVPHSFFTLCVCCLKRAPRHWQVWRNAPPTSKSWLLCISTRRKKVKFEVLIWAIDSRCRRKEKDGVKECFNWILKSIFLPFQVLLRAVLPGPFSWCCQWPHAFCTNMTRFMPIMLNKYALPAFLERRFPYFRHFAQEKKGATSSQGRAAKDFSLYWSRRHLQESGFKQEARRPCDVFASRLGNVPLLFYFTRDLRLFFFLPLYIICRVLVIRQWRLPLWQQSLLSSADDFTNTHRNRDLPFSCR